MNWRVCVNSWKFQTKIQSENDFPNHELKSYSVYREIIEKCYVEEI